MSIRPVTIFQMDPKNIELVCKPAGYCHSIMFPLCVSKRTTNTATTFLSYSGSTSLEFSTCSPVAPTVGLRECD